MQETTPRPGAASPPPSAPTTRPRATSPTPPGRPAQKARVTSATIPWDVPRILVIAGYATVWLAAGFFFNFNYLEVLTGDPPITILLGLGLVFNVWLAVRPRAWLYPTAALAGMVVPLIVLFVFGAMENLGAPLKGGEFVGSWLLVLALLLALPAGVVGFLAARRGASVPFREGWKGAHPMVAIAFVALVFGMTTAGGLATDGAKASMGGGYDFDVAEVGGASQTVAVFDYEFEEGTVIKAGQLTELIIENRDPAFHTFTYEKDGKEYNHDLVSEATVRILVYFPGPGTIEIRCIPHSDGYDDGMVGTMNVSA